MYDGNKSLDVKLICIQCVVTFNQLQGMNPIGLSAPCADPLEIISLRTAKHSRDESNGP